jgi:hypothetical protein
MNKINKVFLLFLCSWCVSAPAGNREPETRIKILHRGMYESVRTATVPDKGIASGSLGLVEKIKLVKETTHVPAVIGAEFGFEYRIEGAGKGESVVIERVDIFPGKGLRHPGESKPRKSERLTFESSVGTTSHMLYKLNHEWEVVPGDWIMQLWSAGTKLAEVRFTLAKPGP